MANNSRLSTDKSRRDGSQNRLIPDIQRIAAKALACFFILMLVFTLVSRGADSLTIAKVTVDTLKTAVLTNRTSLSGKIESVSELELFLPGDLTISAVNVSTGQTVERGDTLFLLDLEEIEEQLAKKKDSLKIAQLRLASAESGTGSADTSAVDNAQRALTQAREDYTRLKEKLERSDIRAAEDLAEAETALEAAREDLRRLLENADEQSGTAPPDSTEPQDGSTPQNSAEPQDGTDLQDDTMPQDGTTQQDGGTRQDTGSSDGSLILPEPDIYADTAAYNGTDADGSDLDGGQGSASDSPEIAAARAAVDAAERAYKNAKRSYEDSIQNSKDQLIISERAIENAQKTLTQAQKQAADNAVSTAKSNRQAEIDSITYKAEIKSLQEDIAELEALSVTNGAYRAPVGGVVRSITEKGTTQNNAAAAVISLNDTGFMFKAEVSEDQAEDLSAGDKGILEYSSGGRSQRADALITAVSTADDMGNVTVTASLSGSAYPSGAQAELTVTSRSDQQNACLPVSALRSSTGGDYVLVLREKRTALGLEQTVTAVPVTVTGRDSDLISLESSLMRDDKVVISSNKPLAEGDRVRVETD